MTPAEYEALKAAGNCSLAKDSENPDLIEITSARFNALSGVKMQPQIENVSITQLQGLVASIELQLKMAKDMLADLEAA